MAKKEETGRNSDESTSGDETGRKFPVVGLGASAGGLEALKVFFSHVEKKSGLAYIVVMHMTAKQPSLMPELLQKMTPVSVSAAEDGQTIAPDNVYVVPPGKDISVFQGKIQLMDMIEKGVSHPIDSFFRSLAQDLGSKAAAVILSGTGTDGSSGIKDIKAENGLILAQSEDSAAYDGMPRCAINTGLVDMVFPPDEMPAKLVRYFSRTLAPPTTTTTTTTTTAPQDRDWLNKVFSILRARTGHDFSAYKVNTLLRRISRRMGLNQIESHDVYVRHLRENIEEADALFRELLIGVTNFFRDAESFDVLKTKVIPGILEHMPDDSVFRAWIPGCSTGEEVYSVAMVLRECLDDTSKRVTLQLFGTDIDNHAIEKAREGVYPESIATDVGPERLKRFFTQEGDFYRIRKDIRDCAVFSLQDLIKDPPFSRLSLLCCRNVLIYLAPRIQKKILPLFHYTLVPNGVLVLGSSETIGGFANLFDIVDRKWKIFRRRDVPRGYQFVDFPSGVSGKEISREIPAAPGVHYQTPLNTEQATQKAILDQFAPTAILIDAKGTILYVQGRTGKYLETPSGLPTQNILDLAREGLRIELSSAIRTAKSAKSRVIRKNVSVKINGGTQMIDLHVSLQQAPRELAGRFLVVFEDVRAEPVRNSGADSPDGKVPSASRIRELEKELQITRESHQSTIEELESSNEELKSTNEELQSANEELQSTNEELESSKEELQSLNEELHTVNAELQNKVEELSAAHDDMRNLLNSTEVATIFVDNEMRIRRFTPEATDIVNLIPTDVGRPLRHVVSNLAYSDMASDLKDVLRKLAPKTIEVRTEKGEWYNMRIIPYRTMDNRIDGAVLTFAYIGEQKKVQEKLRRNEQFLKQAQNVANIGIWEWDLQTGEVYWSSQLYAIYGLNPDNFGPTISSFAEHVHPEDREYVRKTVNDIVSTGISVNFDFRIIRADGQTRYINTIGDITDVDENGKPLKMIGVNLDITDRKFAEKA